MAYNGHAHPGALAPIQHVMPPAPQQQQQLAEAPHYNENDRYYGTYRKGQYLFPVDEEELDRLDIFHKFFQVARKESFFGGLHQRPIAPNGPARILDLGCGTGIWNIDMADRYPYARLVGLDLNYTQPPSIPNTIEFRRQDITDPNWGLEPDSFDLVHMRMLAGCVENWLALYRNILRHLKPGTGTVEHVEIDFRPLSPDGSLPAESRLRHWSSELCAAFEAFGRPLVINPSPGQLLEQAGFVDIQHEEIDIPFHPWDDSEHRKEVGRWFNLGMTQGIEALSLAPLTRIRHYSKEDVKRLAAEVKREISTRALKSSCTMHIWTAKRPASRSY